MFLTIQEISALHFDLGGAPKIADAAQRVLEVQSLAHLAQAEVLAADAVNATDPNQRPLFQHGAESHRAISSYIQAVLVSPPTQVEDMVVGQVQAGSEVTSKLDPKSTVTQINA